MKIIFSLFNLTHSGSRVIFENLIYKLAQEGHFLILDYSQEINFPHNSKIYYVNYESSRFKWLKKQFIEQILIPHVVIKNKIDKIVLFGNLPVLILKIKQVVFFHNLLYIENYKRTTTQVINKLLFVYLIRIKKPRLLVQTKYTQNKLMSFFNLTNVDIVKTLIKFSENHRSKEIKGRNINLIYPSLPYPYKNHNFLIENIHIFESLDINLWLTCKHEELNLNINSPNLHFIGKVDFKNLEKNYYFFDGIINTSEFESLGMYLLEAVNIGMPIISCNKEYVNSAISHYYSFIHLNKDSLKDTLIKFKSDLNSNNPLLPKTHLLGSYEELIKQIIS